MLLWGIEILWVCILFNNIPIFRQYSQIFIWITFNMSTNLTKVFSVIVWHVLGSVYTEIHKLRTWTFRDLQWSSSHWFYSYTHCFYAKLRTWRNIYWNLQIYTKSVSNTHQLFGKRNCWIDWPCDKVTRFNYT